MFNPREFRVTDRRKIHDFINDRAMGIIFSVSVDGDYTASSIPFLVDEECQVLTGHMARANPQWKGLEGRKVLVVFEGIDHYISPTWYGEDYAVPTWNYALVEAWGTFHAIEGKDEVISILDRLTRKNEREVGMKWSADWNEEEYRKMLQGIVAFRVQVTDIEGKWKFSQNHTRSGVNRVAEELSMLNRDASKKVARVMKEEKERHDSETSNEK